MKLKVGDKVEITGKTHPWRGGKGVVIRIQPFNGRWSAVVRLKRSDALDGHECGVCSPRAVRIIGDDV